MGPELDEKGWVKNPVRMDWKSGSVFTTPSGWWHSHHNDTDEEAWVLASIFFPFIHHHELLIACEPYVTVNP